jgi:hypothetical protein
MVTGEIAKTTIAVTVGAEVMQEEITKKKIITGKPWQITVWI